MRRCGWQHPRHRFNVHRLVNDGLNPNTWTRTLRWYALARVAISLSFVRLVCTCLCKYYYFTALIVYTTALASGIVCGYAIDWIRGPNFLRSMNPRLASSIIQTRPVSRFLQISFLAVLAPGAFLGLLAAAQVNTDQLIMAILWLGLETNYGATE